METLKDQVEKLAEEKKETPLDIITQLQTAAAVTNNEELLDQLSELKWEYI